MHHDHFPDAALVLLGHGSTKNAGSSAAVYQHAAELRRRGIFAEVREAFWKQEPNAGEVLDSLASPRAFIVPLFISEGYFSGEVIPRSLGFAPGAAKLPPATRGNAGGNRTPEFFYCKPIGTHERMTAVLLDRARGVVAQFPFPRAPRPKDLTLFVAGHGTQQNENSRQAIDLQVERIRALNEYADVRAIFLEEDPRIPECYRLAPTRNIVIVPFFTGDGLHTQEDIPVLLGEAKRTVQDRLAAGQPTWRNPTERNGKLVWYAPAAGTDPLIAEVILERVREMAEPART